MNMTLFDNSQGFDHHKAAIEGEFDTDFPLHGRDRTLAVRHDRESELASSTTPQFRETARHLDKDALQFVLKNFAPQTDLPTPRHRAGS